MSELLNHVVLTRFNLPSGGAESLIRAKDGWLRGRVALFEQYCLPSMRAQSTDDFSWIIYFDPESPAWLMEWIDGHRAEGLFQPHFRTSVSPEELVADVSAVCSDIRRPGLITTNLDNDDAVATDFIERLQRVGLPSERTAVYLVDGLIKSPAGLYRRVDRDNAFCSVVEDWDAPRTAWADWHNRLGLSMAVRELTGAPGWLQVVHDTNVSNRVRGIRTSPTAFRTLFPGALDDVAVPATATLLRDRFVVRPVRSARELARSTAKNAVLAVVGKDGLDRAKDAVASRGRSLRAGSRDDRGGVA